ncbi:DUF6152 family protein [Denitrobaculum tricleocarpae]|uniref:Twin-arginine translocation signal domain-containing protein n=1 Tax=Denitrobaculum tricleocarpae TaxID=2591009 RepID=A0A545TQW0_9PROT|nr:DUF6152 family protein [Denitrobaculum tricleocarpae]TQV79606.1 hypothetical protein FKG95_12825 [Denitrobaculum tricleocarpae]
MVTRRSFLVGSGITVGLTALGASAAMAHHGWRWTEDGNFELVGLIQAAQLGNPHGVLTVDAEGEIWTVEVGQPWRNERAGLKDEMFAVGTEVTVSGQRSEDPEQKLMKAERVTIDGQLYDLYPNRD